MGPLNCCGDHSRRRSSTSPRLDDANVNAPAAQRGRAVDDAVSPYVQVNDLTLERPRGRQVPSGMSVAGLVHDGVQGVEEWLLDIVWSIHEIGRGDRLK